MIGSVLLIFLPFWLILLRFYRTPLLQRVVGMFSKRYWCSCGWPSSPSFLESFDHILLVIAHPDDEAMFWTPTLTSWPASSPKSVLCLSNGDYSDGLLGEVRALELQRNCQLFGVNPANVHVVNDRNLRDGMNEVWQAEAIIPHLERCIETASVCLKHFQPAEVQQNSSSSSSSSSPALRRPRVAVLTFDQSGVSQHKNHVAVALAVRTYLKKIEGSLPVCQVEGFALVSHTFWRKYLGPLEFLSRWILHLLRCQSAIRKKKMDTQGDPGKLIDPQSLCVLVPTSELLTAVHSMNQIYLSQRRWYRTLFTIFSTYAYVNSYERIPSEEYH